jgi:hypothetical protein
LLSRRAHPQLGLVPQFVMLLRNHLYLKSRNSAARRSQAVHRILWLCPYYSRGVHHCPFHPHLWALSVIVPLHLHPRSKGDVDGHHPYHHGLLHVLPIGESAQALGQPGPRHCSRRLGLPRCSHCLAGSAGPPQAANSLHGYGVVQGPYPPC